MESVGLVPEGKQDTVKILLSCFAGWKTLFFTHIFSKLRLPLRHRHFHTPLGQAARAGALYIIAKEKVLAKPGSEPRARKGSSSARTSDRCLLNEQFTRFANVPVPAPGAPTYCQAEVRLHMLLQHWE